MKNQLENQKINSNSYNVMIEGLVYDLSSPQLEYYEKDYKIGKYVGDINYLVMSLHKTKFNRFFIIQKTLDKHKKQNSTSTNIIYVENMVKTEVYNKFGIDIYKKHFGTPLEA